MGTLSVNSYKTEFTALILEIVDVDGATSNAHKNKLIAGAIPNP